MDDISWEVISKMNPSNFLSAASVGSGFNINELVKQPIVILRAVSILFSIIVFGCISSGCHTVKGACIYDDESSACNFATAVGVLGFLGAIGFIVSDAMFNSVSNVKKRKHIVLGDLVFSGLWTFFYFVGFCLLTNKWIKTENKWLKRHRVENWQENNARSAIIFSLLSSGVWAGITFIALQRFRLNQASMSGEEGAMRGSMPGEGDMGAGAPGSMYTGLPDSTGPTSGPPQQQQQQQYGGAPMQTPISGGQYYSQAP